MQEVTASTVRMPESRESLLAQAILADPHCLPRSRRACQKELLFGKLRGTGL
jgi:hypothetical protein